MYLGEMCWQEASEVMADSQNVFVIPVGSTEQHGCVGPLGTDWLIPQELARRVSDMDHVVICPPLCYGVAPQHINFPGSVDLGVDTMSQVVEKMLFCWYRHGARRFVFLNGHGGNSPAFEQAGLKIYRMGGIVSVINWWSLAPQLNSKWVTGHGDAQEVSAIMAFRPELIKEKYLKDNEVFPVTEEIIPYHMNQARFKGANVRIIREIRDTVSTGGFGGLEAKDASAQWGKEMLSAVGEWIQAFIPEFRKIKLPENRTLSH